jgi:glyoxylase-like metal-dependent hydrolase (beta-lactamase superfamily II)
MKKEDITIIELSFVNAFLVKANEGFILIDTGLPMHWEKLDSALTSAGCLPGKLKLVIITHGDLDHTGNCARLQEKYKCKIAIHKDDSFMVENGIRLKRKARTLSAKIFMTIMKMRRKKSAIPTFKPDMTLTEGQRLSEYGIDATIIHIPGHTKGSIGIMTDDGILFSGDTFNNMRKPELATYIENSDDLKNTYARLKKMNIKTIYPGHGKPFEMSAIAAKL